jgi:histidyl-tRNA synthetase
LSERFFGPIGIASHTVFDIRDNNGTLLANGFRYNHLARRMGFRHDIPALGATISIKNIQLAKRRKETPAKIYIIQIGNEAKRVSLNLLEEFRRAEIKTAHNLSHDKISSQIEHAENLQTPYLAIIGHKEALEGTILIRDRERSFQETLPTPDAIHFLKKLLA